MKAPCKGCEERYKLLEKDIICHSYCKLYHEYTNSRQEIYKQRRYKTDYMTANQKGYGRATRNKYEYETKR